MIKHGGENKVSEIIRRGRRANDRILHSGERKWITAPDWNQKTATQVKYYTRSYKAKRRER